MKIFGRDPSLIVTLVGAVLSYLVMLQLDGLSDLQAAAIMGVLTALVGVLNGVMVRPFNPALFNGLIAAAAGVLVAYGFEVTPEQVNALQAIAVAALGLLAVRPQVTPKVDPVPTAPSEGVMK
jgi:Na+-transporting methylmalonyl-CoA/oxaloacetate decarboxylase beta subunit